MTTQSLQNPTITQINFLSNTMQAWFWLCYFMVFGQNIKTPTQSLPHQNNK